MDGETLVADNLGLDVASALASGDLADARCVSLVDIAHVFLFTMNNDLSLDVASGGFTDARCVPLVEITHVWVLKSKRSQPRSGLNEFHQIRSPLYKEAPFFRLIVHEQLQYDEHSTVFLLLRCAHSLQAKGALEQILDAIFSFIPPLRLNMHILNF